MKLENLLNEQKKIFADKFYTKPSIALDCIKKLNLKKYDRIIEPSAGNGSFSNQIPGVEAYDLYPENNSIKKQDFLKFEADKGNILVIGNPPFGENNNLAVQFINHASTFAKTIAFVLPASFGRENMMNRLNKNIHLSRIYDLPFNSFLVDGKPAGVKSVFCIYEVRAKERKIENKTYHTSDFSFVPRSQADFWIVRHGWKVGRPIEKDSNITADSRMYLKCNIKREDLWKKFQDLVPDLHEITKYSTGAPGVNQQQLLKAYCKKYGES